MTFSDSIINYGHLWFLQGSVLFILLLLLMFRWKKVFKFITSHMIAMALVIWISGVLVYAVGFSFEGTARSFPALIFRSMQAGLGMFLSDNELVEVSEHYKESPVYMTLFSLLHVSALFLSAILIFSTLGTRVKSWVRLFFEAMRARRSDRPTYVFWGVNPASANLARDIRKEQPDSRIVFLISSGENSLGEKLEVTQLIESSTTGHGHAGDAAALGSDLAKGTFLVFIPKEESLSRSRNLRTILESSSILNFFFLTDDYSLNLSLAEMVSDGLPFRISPSQSMTIHVLSNGIAKRYALEEKTVLHSGESSNITLNFVDKSKLSVTYLKRDMNCHPIASFTDEAIVDGTVNDDFNAWILGLGSTGSEMFRFFYEFASFIRPDGKPVKRRITLFDKMLEDRVGTLFRSCPQVLQDSVEAMDMNVGSPAFWELLAQRADSLNCVCITMHDDELDLKIAREIYRHILQFRKDTSRKVRIFVMTYSMQYEGIVRSLAAEYNAHDNNIEIVPFGGVSEIFSSRIILTPDMENAFWEFNYKFDVVRGRDCGLSAEECWKRDFSIQKYLGKYNDAVIALDELYRRITQCHEEVLHIPSLLMLLGIRNRGVECLESIPEKTREALSAASYLRQMSSHQLLGYSPCSEEYSKNNLLDAVRQKKSPYALPLENRTDKCRRLMDAVVDVSLSYALEVISKDKA